MARSTAKPMTDSRKSIFLPQVSRSSSDPGGPAWWPGVGMMEELVYWTPFWSFTNISSTSFFSTLHCFSGATDESLCSGRTWIFIFSCAYDAHAGPVLSRPPAASSGADGLSRCARVRMAIPPTEKRIKECSPPTLELTHPRTWAGEDEGERQRVWRGLVFVRKVSEQLRTARNTGYDSQTKTCNIIPDIADRPSLSVLQITVQHKNQTLYL